MPIGACNPMACPAHALDLGLQCDDMPDWCLQYDDVVDVSGSISGSAGAAIDPVGYEATLEASASGLLSHFPPFPLR